MSESVDLYGEGEYNLNDVKEVVVTNDFMNLEKHVRKCQSVESYSNCTTNALKEKILEDCKCLPLKLGVEKVNHSHIKS